MGKWNIPEVDGLPEEDKIYLCKYDSKIGWIHRVNMYKNGKWISQDSLIDREPNYYKWVNS